MIIKLAAFSIFAGASTIAALWAPALSAPATVSEDCVYDCDAITPVPWETGLVPAGITCTIVSDTAVDGGTDRTEPCDECKLCSQSYSYNFSDPSLTHKLSWVVDGVFGSSKGGFGSVYCDAKCGIQEISPFTLKDSTSTTVYSKTFDMTCGTCPG